MREHVWKYATQSLGTIDVLSQKRNLLPIVQSPFMISFTANTRLAGEPTHRGCRVRSESRVKNGEAKKAHI